SSAASSRASSIASRRSPRRRGAAANGPAQREIRRVTDDLVEAPCASTSRQSSGSGVVYLRLAARPVAAQEIAKVDPIDEDRGDAARRWPRRASLRGLSQAGAHADRERSGSTTPLPILAAMTASARLPPWPGPRANKADHPHPRRLPVPPGRRGAARERRARSVHLQPETGRRVLYRRDLRADRGGVRSRPGDP